MELKDNIKSLRIKNQLSQEQLAEKLNISRQAVSKWESGKAYPDIDNILLLSKLFTVTLDQLVLGEVIEEAHFIDEVEENKIDNDGDKKQTIDIIDEDDETLDKLMVAGLVIGTGIGFITKNFMWGTAFALIGLGVGYIIKICKDKIL